MVKMANIETGEKGIIKEIDGNTVYVTLIPSDACHSCPAKGLCHKEDEERGLWAYNNDFDLSKGDKVKIELISSITLGRIFMFTIAPLLVFLLGYFFGKIINIEYIVAMLFFIIYFLILFFYSKKVKKDIIAKVIYKIDE